MDTGNNTLPVTFHVSGAGRGARRSLNQVNFTDGAIS